MKHFTFILLILLFFACSHKTDYITEFQRHGLVDVQSLDSTIVVDLKYSSTDNFMGINMYGDLNKAYLRPEIAQMVIKAQQYIKRINPEYTLIIYDAARPLSAQKSMYDTVKGTVFQQYVADPYNGGGFHNFGCAIDVTILHKNQPLNMGCDFDCFDSISHITNEDSNLKIGKLTQESYYNRRLLRTAMTQAGFNTEPCEWWHFDYYKKDYVRKHFQILDF